LVSNSKSGSIPISWLFPSFANARLSSLCLRRSNNRPTIPSHPNLFPKELELMITKPPKQQLPRAAIYARVSSEQQTQQGTIESQVAALRQRVQDDGLLLEEELCFVDDGYTGSTLVRPALE